MMMEWRVAGRRVIKGAINAFAGVRRIIVLIPTMH